MESRATEKDVSESFLRLRAMIAENKSIGPELRTYLQLNEREDDERKHFYGTQPFGSQHGGHLPYRAALDNAEHLLRLILRRIDETNRNYALVDIRKDRKKICFFGSSENGNRDAINAASSVIGCIVFFLPFCSGWVAVTPRPFISVLGWYNPTMVFEFSCHPVFAVNTWK